ncbi:hypothetical protein [Amycolatopsis sp. NPDC059021]|uniref:hypothetical protein n=1 Tax=Amycolatopsis sp. NPDC059021 TaxID=3346704 RepID=UPI00366BBC66
MFEFVLAGPRQAVRLARRLLGAALDAAEAVPRIASAVEDVRATLKHVERLASYVAHEVPELVYQLELIRARVDELDKKTESAVSPGSPRTG